MLSITFDPENRLVARGWETDGENRLRDLAAAATTDRDRKELLRTLLEEVIFDLKRAEGVAHLTLRWRGGAITLLDVEVPPVRLLAERRSPLRSRL